MEISSLEIKELRKKLGITQEKLANKLGVTKRTIISYEKGEAIPPSKMKLLHFIIEDSKKDEVSTDFIGKNNQIKVESFLDVFFLYQERIEQNERFKNYLEKIEKDAIIKYQRDLIEKMNKQK